MNLRGYSGCKIELTKDGRIRKTSSSPSYNSRLKQQKKKQADFSTSLSFLGSPKVFSSRRNSFDMEYIRGRDFVSFLSESGKEEIEEFSEKISQYILESIESCEIKKIKKELIEKKILDIYKKRKLLVLLEFTETLPEYMGIPVGRCHGDLTLSNLLMQNEKIILIDFLDSFIESPLVDMAKIRQDTKHKWSLGLYEKEYDVNKINISLDYMDSIINESFMEVDSYRKYYNYFQFLNFARILPYAKGFNKVNYLRDTLSGIITKI